MQAYRVISMLIHSMREIIDIVLMGYL
jgi:hypothetical protein